MTIYLGSRYQDSLVDFVAVNSDTNVNPIVFYSFADLGTLSYFTYLWQNGDRPDNIAARFLGQAGNWWIIAEVNPEIVDITNIAPGTAIRIPHV